MLRQLSTSSQVGGHGEAVRHALNLSIDVSPYNSYASSAVSVESERLSPAPSSARASIATTLETPQSAIEWHVCYVLGLYDFESDDPDHLPFKKNAMLEIVQKEETGWWAALRAERVGWIPSAFVQELNPEQADVLRNTKPGMRIHVYHQLEPKSTGDSSRRRDEHYVENKYQGYPPQFISMRSPGPSSGYVSDADIDVDTSPVNPTTVMSPRYPPPSPSTPMPQPPTRPRANVNKPTPPTPKLAQGVEQPRRANLSRNKNETAASILNHRNFDGAVKNAVGGSSTGPVDTPYGIKEVPDELIYDVQEEEHNPQIDVEAYNNAKVAQSKQPWYLEPIYGGYNIEVEDGVVNAGTVPALIERLTIDFLNHQQEMQYRHAFLATFHTFTNADDVFALLTDRFNMLPPSVLTPIEVADWKEKKLKPTQHRVLTVLMMWLEDYGMLKNDPHIMSLLRDFLSRIREPPPLELTATLMLQVLSRLECADPLPDTDSNTLGVAMSPTPMKRRKSAKSEFLRMDPNDIAQQLTLLEHRLYSRIRPQEPYSWAKAQKGEAVKNLINFCATHDKLASWVKMSVLSNDGLGKRADTIDMWIKIAEKCRNINNISSMASIVTALSSQVIARLRLTWAHVGRGSHLEPMTRLIDPTGNFNQYRNLHKSIDNTVPVIPFIAMYLSDIVQIAERMPDTIPVAIPSPASPLLEQPPLQLVCFLKRHRWYEAANSVTRHQGRSYIFAPNGLTAAYIEAQLAAAAAKDQGSFWARSQDVQQAEVAHADLRKGLEQAGF